MPNLQTSMHKEEELDIVDSFQSLLEADIDSSPLLASVYEAYKERTAHLVKVTSAYRALEERYSDEHVSNAHLKHQLAQLSIESEEAQERQDSKNPEVADTDSAYESEASNDSLSCHRTRGAGHQIKKGVRAKAVPGVEYENLLLRVRIRQLESSIEESLRVLRL